MNTCENCKYWHGKNSNHITTFLCGGVDDDLAYTSADMSCPRFEPKEPEIPAALKDWKPVWHKSEEMARAGRFLANEHNSESPYKLFLFGWWTELP